MRKLIMDLDDTMCHTVDGDYVNSVPVLPVIEKIREYKNMGFTIVINTSRSMRTYQGNVGKINAYTLPTIVEWLNKHAIPYDELMVGKPWCGMEGFYVDDKAIRPAEFVEKSYEEITALLRRDR